MKRGGTYGGKGKSGKKLTYLGKKKGAMGGQQRHEAVWT